MKKQLNLTILVFASLLLGLSFLSAAPTFVTPATSAQVKGTTVAWNATNSSGLIGMSTCNIWIKSVSLTANTTYVNVSTASNTTADQKNITGTFNSALLEDGNDYSIFAECNNATASSKSNSTANTGIIIDNTEPVAASSLSPATQTIDSDGSVTFSGTVTGTQTTSCTLRFSGALPPNGNAQAMTHTGDTCSLTISSIPEQTYTWYIRASDETNTTDSSSIQVTVDQKTSAGATALLASQNELQSEGGAEFSVIDNDPLGIGLSIEWIIGILVGIVVIAIIVKKK